MACLAETFNVEAVKKRKGKVVLMADRNKREVAKTKNTNHITTKRCTTKMKREELRDHSQAKMKETTDMRKKLMKQLRKKKR